MKSNWSYSGYCTILAAKFSCTITTCNKSFMDNYFNKYLLKVCFRAHCLHHRFSWERPCREFSLVNKTIGTSSFLFRFSICPIMKVDRLHRHAFVRIEYSILSSVDTQIKLEPQHHRVGCPAWLCLWFLILKEIFPFFELIEQGGTEGIGIGSVGFRSIIFSPCCTVHRYFMKKFAILSKIVCP